LCSIFIHSKFIRVSIRYFGNLEAATMIVKCRIPQHLDHGQLRFEQPPWFELFVSNVMENSCTAIHFGRRVKGKSRTEKFRWGCYGVMGKSCTAIHLVDVFPEARCPTVPNNWECHACERLHLCASTFCVFTLCQNVKEWTIIDSRVSIHKKHLATQW
jgi:hypothetical protein